MNIVIYFSFDLSFNSDFDGLYKWLDENSALECGNSTCRIFYHSSIEKLETYEDTRSVFSEIRASLQSRIRFEKNDRIYVASYFPDDKNIKRLAGAFIIGARKPNPWDGYSETKEQEIKIDTL